MAETAHTAESEHAHGDHGGHGGHGVDHEKHYWKIYWALVGLFSISVAGPFVGEWTGIKAITLTTAFGIAVWKAALVVRNFMHLTLEPKFVLYISTTAVVIMGLFFFWVAPDVMKHTGHQWVNVAALAASGEGRVVEAGPFEPEETFQAVCASCHGVSGSGDGPAAVSLDPRPAAFADPEFWQTRTRESVIDVITRGGAAVGKSPLMPSWGETYTPEQVAALADVVVGFREEAEERQVVEDVPRPVEGADAGVAAEAPETQVAEAPVAAEPAGISEAENAARSDWITRRLYR